MSSGFGPLVDTDWLEGHVDHSPLRVADCRWYLTDPGAGRRAYEAGHIPGAAHLSVDDDLSARRGPGRHPLPPEEQIAERLGAFGIGDRNFVVAYDDAGGSIAARLWWMLRSIGHRRVAALNGGLQAWTAAGGDLATDEPVWPPAQLTILGASQTIGRDALAARLGGITLIDARAGESATGARPSPSTRSPVTSRRRSTSRPTRTWIRTGGFSRR